MFAVFETLKLNAYKPVSLPTPREYAERFGFRETRLQYSGDEVVPTPVRKIDSISQMDALNNHYLQKEAAEAAAASAAAAAPAEPAAGA